ncbi:winged helix-turn-helix transcriptional regulator [Serratia ureilytica]
MAYPGDVYSSKCSARDALALISGKWVMLILPALAQRPMRNGELLRRIDGISQKVLTQTLRQLERNGLLERLDLSEKSGTCGISAQRRRLLAGRDADGAGPLGGIPFPRAGRRPRAL